jgi:regulatory protein YycH of two-component signal transduction system YycFG
MSNDEFKTSMENATKEIITRIIAKMQLVCLQVERDSIKNCSYDTGVLRASIFSQVGFDESGIIGRVGCSSEIAPYVHQGTGLYAVNGDGRKTPWAFPIENLSPKYRDKFKIIKINGKEYAVTHGQKPNPFLQKARDDNKDKILGILAGD